MAKRNQAEIKITARNQLKAGLHDAMDELGQFGKTVEGLGKLTIGAGIGAAIFKIGEAAANCTKNFLETEDAYLRMAKSLGSEDYNKAIKSLDKFSKKTKASRDEIAIMMSTLASIGKTSEEIDKITEAAISLSTVTGQDLKGAMDVMLDSLNGSTGEIEKYLPQVKELTKEELALGGAIDIVIDKLGGMAQEVSSNSFSQTVSNIKNTFDSIGESIGSILTSQLGPVFDWILDQLENIDTRLKETRGAVTRNMTPSGVVDHREFATSTTSDLTYLRTLFMEMYDADNYTGSRVELKKAINKLNTELQNRGFITDAEALADAIVVNVDVDGEKVPSYLQLLADIDSGIAKLKDMWSSNPELYEEASILAPIELGKVLQDISEEIEENRENLEYALSRNDLRYAEDLAKIIVSQETARALFQDLLDLNLAKDTASKEEPFNAKVLSILEKDLSPWLKQYPPLSKSALSFNANEWIEPDISNLYQPNSLGVKNDLTPWNDSFTDSVGNTFLKPIQLPAPNTNALGTFMDAIIENPGLFATGIITKLPQLKSPLTSDKSATLTFNWNPLKEYFENEKSILGKLKNLVDADYGENARQVGVDSIFDGLMDSLQPLIEIFDQFFFAIESGCGWLTILIPIIQGLVSVIAPAITAVIQPFIDSLTWIGEMLGSIFLPIFDSLYPYVTLIAQIIETAIAPSLELIAPFLEVIAAVLDVIRPILVGVAVAFEYLMAPIKWLGDLFSWCGEWIATFGENVGIAIYNLGHWFSPKEFKSGPGAFSSDAFSGLDNRTDNILSLNMQEGAISGSTANAIQGASYQGAMSLTINNNFYAPVVGEDGMDEFAQMIRTKFEELNYYGV